jgi:hypothetical protein
MEYIDKITEFVAEHKKKIIIGFIVLAVLWAFTSCVDGTTSYPTFND